MCKLTFFGVAVIFLLATAFGFWEADTSRTHRFFGEIVPPVETSETIAKYVLDRAQNGSIILLHVMNSSQNKSLNAVKPIIEGLKQKGFRFVTVSELINGKK